MNSHKALAVFFSVLVALCFEGCSRRIYAKVTVEFGQPGDTNAENSIRALLPKNDHSVSLVAVRNTGLYEIGVRDPDPHNAAKRPNELALRIQARLYQNTKGKRFKIWERAEPPFEPAR